MQDLLRKNEIVDGTNTAKSVDGVWSTVDAPAVILADSVCPHDDGTAKR